mgnify:FL=1|jgi:hypothetical protein
MKYVLFILALLLSSCAAIPECTTRTVSFAIPDGIPFVQGAFAFTRDNAHVDCGKTLEQLEQDNADRARLGIRLWPSDDDE